jgi:prepilin-type N-terminal cleavage/methylation domain-containing protein
MPRVTPNARRARRGMTLIEIMISMVLLGIVGGVIMRVITRQQRFYQGVNQIMTQRGQLRQATAVLPMDLRSLSSIDNDLRVVSDSSIEFDQTIGTSVVCEVVSGSVVALPPETLSSGYSYTSFFGYGTPDAAARGRGVWVYIYNDSSVVGNQDDRWQKFELTGVTENSANCGATPFTTLADAGKTRVKLTLADSAGATDLLTGGPISRYIGVGAPVRIVKRVRYKLYQASDSKWYLGFEEYDKGASDWKFLAPVSGPYEPYATSGGTGIGFKYYDVDGTEIAPGAVTADRARIARIDLVARAKTSSNVRAAGIQNGVSQQYKDSLAASIMIRNRQ